MVIPVVFCSSVTPFALFFHFPLELPRAEQPSSVPRHLLLWSLPLSVLLAFLGP